MTLRVLVTGASSGIGQAIAATLAEKGLTVFGTSRHAVDGAITPFTMLPLDVRSDHSVRACVGEVLERAGGIDVLVNNAGYALTGAAEETSIEEAKEQFDTNFFGVVRVTNAVLPAMRRAGSGKIITLGSLVGLLGIPFASFYSATKFAIEGYSEALWYELRPFGISVSMLEPGWVRTALTDAGRIPAHSLPVYEGPKQLAAASIRRYVADGLDSHRVTDRVLEIIDDPSPRLRYPVGGDATWLPRLKVVAPWSVLAAGVRKRFGQPNDAGRPELGR